MFRGIRNVLLAYAALIVGLYALGPREILAGGVGLTVGIIIGRRGGRREATFDAARELARSRPDRTFAILDREGAQSWRG